MNNTEDIYTLALDNNYFDDNILIDKNERIIPVRVMKADKIINKDTYKMNILDINKNNYSAYILYEIIDGDM